MMFGIKYLNDARLKGFERYKYNSVDTSYFSKYVVHPFWNWSVQYLPTWLAPNLITFVGFLMTMVNFILLAYYDWDLTAANNPENTVPNWVWSVAAVNILIRMYYIIRNVVLNFYLTHIEKYNTGVMFLPWAYDVIVWGVRGILFLTTIVGPAIWHLRFYNLSIANIFEVILISSGMISSHPIILKNIYMSYKNTTSSMRPLVEAARPLFPFLFLFVIILIWCLFSRNSIIDLEPQIMFLLFGTLFSNIACRLIVAKMSDTRCDGFNKLMWPLLATVAVSCFPWYENYIGMEISADGERWILQGLTIFVTFAYLRYGQNLVSAGSLDRTDTKVSFDYQDVNKFGSVSVPPIEVVDILTNSIDKKTEGNWNVQVPSKRSDVKIPADLIEEVTGKYDYEKIKVEPLTNNVEELDSTYDSLRILMTNRGLYEVPTSLFLSESAAEKFGYSNKLLTIDNPFNNNFNIMRPSIIPNLLQVTSDHISHGVSDLAIFEVGPIYDSEAQSKHVLSGIRTGNNWPRNHYNTDRNVDVFDAMADCIAALEFFNVNCDNLTMEWAEKEHYHPGKSFTLSFKNNVAGYFGELDPNILDLFDIKQKVIGFKVILENIENLPSSRGKFIDYKYQNVKRDFAFIVNKDVKVGNIINVVKKRSVLGHATTAPEHKNTFMTAVHQLAGQSPLNMRYKRKTVEATETHNDKRQEIKYIIREEIAEHKSDLAQVKSYIAEKFQKSLSTIDVAYIEKKYIKYCTTFWLQETKKLLKELTEGKSRTVIQEIFNLQNNVKDLSQIPNPLNQLEFYTLLMEHYKLVRKEDEKTFISRFRKEYLEQIVAYSDSAKKELVLLESFVNFLSFSKKLPSIITELELKDFYRGYLSFDKLIKNIKKLEHDIYGENLKVLQEATRDLKNVEDLLLIEKFKEVIGAYIKPIEIQQRRIDDRLVVEVQGKHIVVSKILSQLENTLLENQNIEEVRFVGADIIHIDSNLKSRVWQGRNVVILTNEIKVYDQLIWDVSGKDNDYTYSDNAGTHTNGHGKQGADGNPGESGGNVLILAEKIENPEDLTIISNGGKGSKGQDGGNGKDGEDGYNSVDTSYFSKYVVHPFWNWSVQYLPTWLAPNLITFVGFLMTMVNFILLAYYDWDLTAANNPENTVPNWVWSVAAVNILIRMYYIIRNVVLNFYLTHIEKYNTGVMFLPWAYDVIVWGVRGILFLTTIVGPAIWHLRFYNLSIANIFEVILISSGMISSHPIILKNIYMSYKNTTSSMRPLVEAARPLFPFLFLFVIILIWCLFSRNSIIDLEPQIMFLLFGTLFSNIACRLIVAKMSDTRCDGFNKLMWPLLATVAVSCFPWYENYIGMEISADGERWILQGLTIFVTFAYLRYGQNLVSAGSLDRTDTKVSFDYQDVNKFGSVSVPPIEVVDILTNSIDKKTEGNWNVQVPSKRSDVKIPADLIEEVTGKYDYEKIKVEPLTNNVEELDSTYDSLRILMTNRGLYEVPTSLFLSESAAEKFGYSNKLLTIDNPFNNNFNIMRPSIIPNLLQVTSDHISHGVSDLAIFEVGPIYDSEAQSKHVLSGIRTGNNWPRNHYNTDRNVDVFDAMADCIAALEFFNVNCDNLTMEWAEKEHYHPGKSFTLSFKNNVAGYFGELDPNILDLFDIKQKVIGFKVILENIENLPSSRGKFIDYKYQNVKRDFAFIVNKDVKVGNIINVVKKRSVLGHATTAPEHKNTFMTAVHQLAGQSPLNMRYKRKTVEATETHNDKRQEIKYIIREEIAEHKSDLAQVKSYIAEKFQKSLSTIDVAYIEKKYIKYCTTFWLQETKKLLKELTEGKSRTVIQEIFNLQNNVKDLSQIPNPLNQLEFYTLLMEHYKLVRKEDEKTFISRFRKEYLEQIVAYSDSAKKELVLLESFVNFLSFSKKLPSIITELELKDFYRGYLSFDKLIKNIKKLEHDIYGENLKVLQEATRDLKNVEDLLLIEKFKEVIGAYIKPIEIQQRRIDDRLVVEVQGKHIVVSKILSQLENTLLENQNIEEVRFVGADIIHIDSNLKSRVWQGRNVVILTNEIKVYDQLIWDVSGKDNDYTYSDNAGTHTNGHGKQGADGNPGESGGNVLILAEKIENPEDLTIISNGGKGSKGQDGGNGKDGEDGVGITKVDFDKEFPSVVKLAAAPEERQELVSKTIKNIKKNYLMIRREWYEKTEKCLAGDIFVEVTTNQGNEVFFSYCHGSFSTRYQAFLLYKGSSGQPGGHGGEYGLGGQGGYAGEIIVRNLDDSTQAFGIIKNTMQGEEGEKGQGGLYGNHGKNGWDMGYLDYQSWPEVKFRGRDQNSKCTLEYYDSDNDPSDRVWSPYKNKYAGINATRIEHKKQKKYEERKNTRKNNDRKHHAQAVRKKNISQSSTLANYSLDENILQDLRSDLDNTKQRALQEITENQEQQEKQTTELKIKCHSRYQNKSKRYNRISITTLSNNYRETIDVESFIGKLEKAALLLDNWLQLNEIEVNFSQLNQLFSILKTVEGNSPKMSSLQNNTELQSVKKLLTDKYRLATLQEIAKRLPPYQEVINNVELTPENAARYLIEAKDIDNNISHHILGTLNQYLYENSTEQHKKIFKFGKEELQNTENKALKYSIRAFVLEVGELEEEHTDVQKYYNEYKKFIEGQERRLNIFFEAFKSELAQTRHEGIFDLYIKSDKDKSLIRKLEEKIQEDNFLKILYDRFKNQREKEYDWDKCCKDQAILKEYNNYIQEKGALSESYRELLAYVFDINIRLYDEDQDNSLFLRGDYNPSSRQAIHILCRGSKFIQLNIDKNYLKLEEERKKKDSLYAQIFAEIRRFKQKEEFDDYLNNQAFLSNNSPSEDEQYFNENEDIEKIIEYFPEGEKQQLKERLNKIASQYIRQQGILHNMLQRFSSEGRHVSSQELYCLVNSILTCITEDRKEQNTFCWIVAANSQRDWIDELILMQLENSFKKQIAEKSKWREYLSKIENKDILVLFKVKLDQHKSSNSISAQSVEDTLHLLSNIPNETVHLEGLELSEWPYALKEKYWTCKLSKLVDWQKADLPKASYYLLSIENIFGSLLAEKLIKALEKKKQELSSDKLTNILSNFHNEKWNLSEIELNTLNSCSIDSMAQKIQHKFTACKGEREITQLVELIKGNANTSKEILKKLPKIKNHIESIDKYIIAGKPVGSLTEGAIKNWVKKFRGRLGERKQDIEEEMLAVIERAIELTKEMKLRDTQKLTVLALLTNDSSTLAQVSTGEGKSLIVVAASIMKALFGEKVDIITSSSVLAKRDAEGYRDIFNLFGINVSHNCSEDIEKRKEAYSDNQVVYGNLSNFQRDYLLDKFYGKNILGDRNFNNVIVDEVDSMLLDKGNNMLYLSHDLAGLDKLESVYIYIWQWINRPARDHAELCYSFDAKAIKEAVINDLYGLVKKEDIGTLGPELSEQQTNIIWERLIKAKILDDQGKLLKGIINDNELQKVLSAEFNCYKDRLRYLLRECFEREKFIHVPNYLRPFIEQHLESWINNAITAFFMKAGEDYVVDVDKTGSSPDRNPNITILDRDTGTDQANSQWDEALHQFLQLKHGCKLSLQSLKAVFISNVSFFKLYSNLYGLTGTLGSQRERDLLQKIHEVDFVTIPTAKSKQFHEEKPILCTGKDEWIKRIYNEAKKLTEEDKRSVLIICETVSDVDTLYKAFGEKDAKHVYTYTRDYEEFDRGFEIVQGSKMLGQGQIIIATNLAGRGTDIKIKEELKKARGLHVCLTYLPSNIRVEEQAFGRAARSGDQGSGQLIIMGSKGQEYSNSKIFDFKKERDAEELHRISDIKAYYDTQITIEESCFKAFKEQYEQLKKDLDNKKVPTEVKEILLQSCLDKWSFWLDEHSKHVRNLTDELDKRNLYSLLEEFISRLKFQTEIIEHDSTSWSAWVEGNPIQMIKLGKYLSQNEKHKNAHKNAIELFDEVIKKEPYFSEAARYYKAFALLKKVDLEQKPLKEEDERVLKEFKQELREAARLFDEHSKFAINAAGIIGKIKKNNNEGIIQIDAYEEQQKTLANLYYMFSRSIDDIFGHTITPQSFANDDINEELAESLYKDLLEKNMLTKPRVKKSISEEELQVISDGYGVSVETLKNVLSEYEGKEFNEKEFQNSLKKGIKLPDRKEFWKLLIQGEVLSEEVKCIVINNEKLKEIDPSLLDHLTGNINQKVLEKQTLELNNEQILLYAEQVTEQQNNGNIFNKDDLIKIVGKDKYKVLKERGVFSFNRKAHIDPTKIESMIFPCYDSITQEDFTKVNITKSEADKILAELVKQKVIEKKGGSESNAYGLKIKFDEIKQVQLSFCPLYEDVLRGLISTCFTYRIALQKIAVQLKEKNFPVRLQLIAKPHQCLVFELLEQKIIRPTMVATKDEDLEEKLKSIYSQNMTEDNFKCILSESKLIPEQCIEELFGFLVKKEWITKYDPMQSIQDEGIRAISKENIKNTRKSFLQDLYCINSPDKRQKPLSFFPEGSNENVLTKLQSIDKTVEKILDNQFLLAKKDTIKNIVSTLKRSRSSLKALKVPDSKLTPLTETCDQGGFANLEELHVFFLNGLDQLLQLEEQKWTQEMLFNTVAVTAMGVCQIAIGSTIELYSVGVMTHVGAAFISEGVSDLFFAAGALKSGYFSWEDYRQHKLQSLMFTAVTAGIGAFISRGAKVSRYGYKLAGPNFEIGEKLAEMSGTQLIETVGWKIVGKEVAKRITLKTLEGVAFGLAYAGVDILVENCLQALCEGIASDILSDIERVVEEHNISKNLEEAFKVLGREKAEKIIDDLTKSVLTRQSYVEEFLPIASKIVSSVTQGLTEAVKKRSKTSNKFELPIYTISKIVVWIERSLHIANIQAITSNLLGNLDQEIKGRLNKLEKDLERNQKQEVEKDYESFKKGVIDQWKSLLRKQAGQIIGQHIVSPVLKKGASHLFRFVGKKLQESYQSYKERGNFERLESLNQEYKENLQSVQHCDNSSETKNLITEKYHNELLKLMRKTRDPDLIVAILREGIPMDMVCVSACIPVVNEILKDLGFTNLELSIIVEGDGGIRQEFSSTSEGSERIIIPLQLKDNHFTLCGSTSENNRSGESKNNCLYEAISKALPGLEYIISLEEFIDSVANRIKHDKGIRYHIQQGWHQLPISLGAFGGAIKRKPSKQTRDEESSSNIDNDNEHRYRIRKVSDHLVCRFIRFFRFGGMIQRASEDTSIPRNQVVEIGASQFQDQSSHRGRNIHSSHVLRFGEINPKMAKENESLYNEFVNFLGHTQNVPKYANDWHETGGDIDRFQSKNLKLLEKIDFRRSLTAEDADTIKRIKEEGIALLDRLINGGKLTYSQIYELKNARAELQYYSIEAMFEKGKQGYLGKGKEAYQ